MQERNAQYKAQSAQNKAIREANTDNTNRTGFQVGLLNIQRGQKIRQLTQRGADIGQAELQTLSTSSNNAAASGNVGASVDAVRSDAQLQFERARGDLQLDNEIEAFNYNTALHDLIQGGQDKLVDYVKATGPSDGAILGNALISVAGTYASSRMSLGLGNAPTAQAQPTASFRR
jgi:hypothetical protein